MPAARVFAPDEAVPDLEAWLAFSQRLENVDYGLHVTSATPGATFRLRNDLELKILPGRHRVPTVGYLFSEIKHKLREEFLGLPGRGSRPCARRASRSRAARRRRSSPIRATARRRFSTPPPSSSSPASS